METKNMTLKVPIDLYRIIEKLSEQEQRSMTQQLIYLARKGLISIKNEKKPAAS